MNALWFHHDGLENLVKALNRADLDAAAVMVHIRDADLEPRTVGLFHAMASYHYEAREAGQNAAFRITRRLFFLEAEIEAAAKWYKETDRESASNLDAQYPRINIPPELQMPPSGTPRPPGFVGPIAPQTSGPRQPSTFQDAVEPQDALRRPMAGDRPDFDWQYNWITDIISPAAAARALIQQVFGYDVVEWLFGQFSGDWNGLWGCGVRWHQASAALGHIAGNVLAMAAHQPTVWEGNAADACQMYVYRLVLGIQGQARLFGAVGDRYYEAARTAFAVFNAIGILLQGWVDSIVAAAVVASSGPVGAGWLIARAIKLLYDVYKAFTNLMDKLTLVGTAIAVLVNLINGTPDEQQYAPLPAEAYDHPAVRSEPEDRNLRID